MCEIYRMRGSGDKQESSSSTTYSVGDQQKADELESMRRTLSGLGIS